MWSHLRYHRGMSRDVYIGFSTALAFWHAARLERASTRSTSWIGSKPFRPYPAMRVWRAGAAAREIIARGGSLCGELGIPESTLHVLVANKNDRTAARGFVSHVVTPSNLPVNSFCSVSPNLHVAVPELVFLQMAGILAFEDLVELGYMMCGTYSISFGRGGQSIGCPPLTTKSRLTRYLANAKAIHGLTNAVRAARFICDGSNSPRESQSALLLCLPPRLYGMACTFPELNPAVDVGGLTIHPDFYWRSKRVVGEYNGGQHAGLEQMLENACRSNALTGKELRCFTITNVHLSDTLELIRLGDLVRRLIGARKRTWTPEHRRGLDRLRRRYTDPYRTRRWERLILQGEWI